MEERSKVAIRKPIISPPSHANTPIFSFIRPLILPVSQPTREQKKIIAEELNEKQERIEKLEKELEVAKRFLPNDGSKIEQALYRNPLQSVAVLLMVGKRGQASLKDIEEICQGKMLEVLCDCIKNDLIRDLDGKLTLTSLGMQCTHEWRRMLQ